MRLEIQDYIFSCSQRTKALLSNDHIPGVGSRSLVVDGLTQTEAVPHPLHDRVGGHVLDLARQEDCLTLGHYLAYRLLDE